MEFFSKLLRLRETLHDRREAQRERDELTRQRDDLMHQRDDLMHQRDDLMRQRDDLMRQRDAMLGGGPQGETGGDDAGPSILLNTLPKSASVFILETLAGSLGKTIIPVSPGYFPTDHLDWRKVEMLVRTRAITQTHVDASELNLRIIRRIDRVIVQIRDPRQALLSWVHHLRRLKAESQQGLIDVASPPLPPDYFERSLEAQIDFQIDGYLPAVVQWICDWLEVVDGGRHPNVMLTRYEDFVADKDAYFAALLSFVGVDPARFPIRFVEATTDRNFRSGQTREWEQVFTPEQSERCAALIPPSLAARMQ